MKLLALDTATEACSAALYIDGEIAQRYQLAPREHSKLILQMLDDLLAEAGVSLKQLDALAFGRGPGSFMGLRIAAGVVQGIALAHELPIVPVSTLASIAHIAMAECATERVLAAIDARMDEVYWGAYQRVGELPLLLGAEQVIPPQLVPLPDGTGWLGAGTGWGSYAATLNTRLQGRVQHALPQCFPSAASIATLALPLFLAGKHVDAAQAIPVYLRDNVAKTIAERQRS